MTLRSLLLGSAGAVLLAGGAQAADLGAEPVNYVKVCDAFGAGFYYAPGTDTCIKISGWVRLDIEIPGAEPYAVVSGVSYNASHRYTMYNQLQVTAASMTEYGPMIGYIAIEQGFFGAGPGSGVGQFIGFDAATLSLGPLSAGWAWSSFANNIYSTYHNAQFSPLGGNHALFVQLSWAFDGVGLFIAAEDYRTRDFGGAGVSTGQIPDIVGGVSFNAGPISAKVTAGWGDRIITDTYGIHGDVGLGLGALGNLNVQATYSKNADDWSCWRVTTACGNAGDYLGIYAGLSSTWSPQFSTLIAGLWYDDITNNVLDYTRIIGQVNFTPVRNFLIGAEVSYTTPTTGPDVTTGIVRLQRSFP